MVIVIPAIDLFCYDRKDGYMQKEKMSLGSIFKELDNKLNRCTKHLDDVLEDSLLYHYTDLNGFMGIFDTKDLWASNALFLNDSSELKYGLDLSRDKFEKVFLSISDKKTKEKFENFYKNYLQIILKTNSFVVSFCEDGDLLSQWRGYTKDYDGISIGFNHNLLRKHTYKNIFKVTYEYDRQTEMLNIIFDTLKKIFLNYENNNQFDIYHCLNHWVLHFIITLLSMKDISFSEEKEWRIIYNIDTLKNIKIDFRVKNNYILPYRKLPFSCFEEIVQKIILGPSPENNMLEMSIRYFFEKKGYNNFIITRSRIPYRK
jgi:hypothetical protein